MADWHLAPSLVRNREWNRKKWPAQINSLDGSIGDRAHTPPSDHLPNSRRSVNAIDEDERGIHMPTWIVAGIVHPSTNYLIYEKHIYSARYLFKRRVYTGTANPHDRHGHLSVWQTVKAEQSKTEWGITGWPTLINGSTGRAVNELQGYLNVYGWPLAVDGHFGEYTERAVREFQAIFKVPDSVDNGRGDGVVGDHTEYALKTCKAYQAIKTRW